MNNFEGIILKKVPFKENSEIIYLYTKDGIDSVLCKGAKKVSSNLHSLNDLFLRISYNKTNSSGLATLISYDILNSYKHIKSDITEVTYLNLIFEVLYKVNDLSSTYELYFFLVKALEMVDDGFDIKLVTDIFLVKYLYLLGISPNFHNCTRCNSKEVAGFSIEEGGVVCANHLSPNSTRDLELISYLAKCYYVDLASIDFEWHKDALKLIMKYYEYHLNIRFKSMELVDLIM